MAGGKMKDEDMRVGVDRFPERQPIGTAADDLDRDYSKPPPAPIFDASELSSWPFYRAGIAESAATFLFLYGTILTVMGVSRSRPSAPRSASRASRGRSAARSSRGRFAKRSFAYRSWIAAAIRCLQPLGSRMTPEQRTARRALFSSPPSHTAPRRLATIASFHLPRQVVRLRLRLRFRHLLPPSPGEPKNSDSRGLPLVQPSPICLHLECIHIHSCSAFSL